MQLPAGITIRDETEAEAAEIGRIVGEAFRDAPHASGDEAAIVERLRAGGGLTLSLVAVDSDGSVEDRDARAVAGEAVGDMAGQGVDGIAGQVVGQDAGDDAGEDVGPDANRVAGRIVGHVAFSPVGIVAPDVPPVAGWYGLGPLAVLPAMQGRGIGGALVRHGLARLRTRGAAGVVLVGDPGYYGRFGFRAEGRLAVPCVPSEFVLTLSFAGGTVAGEATFDAAFGL